MRSRYASDGETMGSRVWHRPLWPSCVQLPRPGSLGTVNTLRFALHFAGRSSFRGLCYTFIQGLRQQGLSLKLGNEARCSRQAGRLHPLRLRDPRRGQAPGSCPEGHGGQGQSWWGGGCLTSRTTGKGPREPEGRTGGQPGDHASKGANLAPPKAVAIARSPRLLSSPRCGARGAQRCLCGRPRWGIMRKKGEGL